MKWKIVDRKIWKCYELCYQFVRPRRLSIRRYSARFRRIIVKYIIFFSVLVYNLHKTLRFMGISWTSTKTQKPFLCSNLEINMKYQAEHFEIMWLPILSHDSRRVIARVLKREEISKIEDFPINFTKARPISKAVVNNCSWWLLTRKLAFQRSCKRPTDPPTSFIEMAVMNKHDDTIAGLTGTSRS